MAILLSLVLVMAIWLVEQLKQLGWISMTPLATTSSQYTADMAIMTPEIRSLNVSKMLQRYTAWAWTQTWGVTLMSTVTQTLLRLSISNLLLSYYVIEEDCIWGYLDNQWLPNHFKLEVKTLILFQIPNIINGMQSSSTFISCLSISYQLKNM